MAKELSQEEVLDFLCQGGGKVPNASLLAHFKHFLRDPQAAAEQLLKRRERFKRYVNSVAVVKPEGAVKYVVLRSRYRDLLGEELTIPGGAESHDQLSNNGDEMGCNVLHGAQVGGGWSAHTTGNHPAHQYQGLLITLHQPDWTGEINPTSHGQIGHYTEHCDPEIRLPSSQPPSSSHTSVSRDRESTSPPSNNSSPVSHSYLPNKNICLHDNNQTLLAYRTSFQLPSDTSFSPSHTHIPSQTSLPSHTHIPSTRTSSSPTNTSKPSTKNSSPTNTSIPFTRTSFSPSDTSIPSTKTSSPGDSSITSTKISSSPSNTFITFSKTSSSPSNTSIPSTKTSSPGDTYIPSTKISSSPTNTSLPITKTTSPSNSSIPFSKTSSSPSNATTKTSEPPSNTSSPYSKDYYPADNFSAPYSKNSSLCSSAEPPSLPGSPSLGGSEHWGPLPGGDSKSEAANPPFVSESYRGQQEQKLGCTEILASNCDLNGSSPQEVHAKQEDQPKSIKEQKIHGVYEEPTASSRFMDCTHPSSSLLLPHESSITPLDVQLEYHQLASPCPSPPLLPNDMYDMWMCQMPVFKSIRCQLSLQDLEDFVDQESCGSEESDSGEGGDCDTEHKDDEDFSSDSNTEKYAQFVKEKSENTRRCPPNRKFLSIIEQYDKLQSGDLLEAKDTLVACEAESSIPADARKSPYAVKSFLTDQAPIMFELAKHPPKHRASSRFQEIMSSSDDELIDRDFRKRRHPSRTKRPPDIVLVPPQPDVDMLLSTNPVNTFLVNPTHQKVYQAQYELKANVDCLPKKSFNYKSSTVPLDPTEHDWIVMTASGSWLQVYGLFSQDPQLAQRKDFISGYTALHWFAKHGAIEMFNKFVAGSKKAGVELDFNIKSNGGYTPLHIAAIHGHHTVAAMLVEKLKVNVKLRDNSGKRAWQYLNCNTSGEVWQLLGAPKGKTIFASRTLNTAYHLNTQNKSSQINRKTSLAAFLKPQHQKWKANNHPVIREREIYSD
ncbi:ankyrin repeat domain-containing protein SOWAHB [Pyxicephalus adspersus]|uniref:ankyrin repeat domain-containing protein SOWAHB n=1 Tax=Pyxicephalus adspersus TaxID=30357 RepID=UPI003B59B91C